MCGRSSLTKTEKELEARFKATFYSDDLVRYNPLPNYNVAPTNMCPVITSSDPTHFNLYRWGLIPFWAKDMNIGYKMINARIETIKEKSTYKSAIAKRRCLVPMDGFYEWKKEGSAKQPYRIVSTKQDLFSCAGMWETWKAKDGELVHSFTVITTPPNEMMNQIHDRMPAMLTPEEEAIWLDEMLSPSEAISLLETPYPSDNMKAYPVDPAVGNVRNNYPELIEPIDLPK